MKWISVEDVLPPLGKSVLVWDRLLKSGKGMIKQTSRGISSQKNFWYREYQGIDMGEPRYSHWMPLPAPPDGQG